MPEASEFTPSLSKEQTRNYIKSHEINPRKFDEQALESLRMHSQYHNVPFYEGDFSIFESVKQAGAGFIEGFTTLNIADPADNEWEAVARSVGHLVGFAPGILSAPLSKIRALQGASKMLRGVKGIPLYFAEKYITPKASKIANAALKSSFGKRAENMGSVTKYLVSKEGRHIAEGAFNLGTASALSSWQHGVDAMLESFMGGAIAGGTFRLIGNRINLKDPKSERYARGLAGSLFMGLPATARGASTPEQIYEYLMGAYFGGSEKPWTEAKAMKFAQKGHKKSLKDTEWARSMDPELVEGWEKLEPEVQKKARPIFTKMAGENKEQATNVGFYILEQMEQLHKIPVEKREVEAEKLGRQILREQKHIDKEIEKIEKEAVPIPDPKTHYIISSGEKGVQSYVTSVAEKRNIPTIQVQFPGQSKVYGAKKSTENLVLPQEFIVKGNKMIAKAVENIKKSEIKYKGDTTVDIAKFSEYIKDSLRRDARNIFYSQAVVSVDSVAPSLKTVAGISKYAVQMAIDKGKPTFVFDKKFNSWFKYDYTNKRFEPTNEIPELKPIMAFFGKKALDPIEKLAINKIFEEYDKLGFKDEITKKVDKEVEEHEKDVIPAEEFNPGEGISGVVDNKMSGLVAKYIGPEIKKTVKDRLKRQERLGEISKSIIKNSKNFINPGSLNTKSQEWIKSVEKEIGEVLPQPLKDKMRAWLARKNQEENVAFIMTDGEKVELSVKENPYSLGNTSKRVKEPPKLIEEIFYLAGGKKDGTPVIRILDHITFKGVDYNLSNFEYSTAKSLQNKYTKILGYTPKISEMLEIQTVKKREAIYNVIKEMNKKGFHPYGGSGDKDRIVFIKYHPDYKKVNISKVKLNKSVYSMAKDLLGLNKVEHDNIMKSIIKYSEDLNGKTISEMIGNDGFIKNAVAENKRAQIWMTNGIRGDKEFIKNPKNVGNLRLSQAGNFKGYLVADPKKVENILKALNIELPQHVDGAILATSEVVDAMNKDAGVPATGSNKSFLISRNPDGTILGKYMIVKVHPEMSKMMNKYDTKSEELGEGIQFLMHSSAIKQRGDKKIGDYNLEGGRLNLTGEGKVFEINPGDFRYSQSVINDNHMLGLNEAGNKAIGVTLIKQLNTNQHPDMFSPVKQEVIDDMYNNIAQKAFDGKKEINNKILEYIKEPSDEKIDDIIDNFSDVGLKQIETVLKTPGQEKLAQSMLVEIIKLNKESIDALNTAGEMSGNEAEIALRESVDFHSAADNILKHVSTIKDGYPLYFDKFTRKYINKALDRFVGQRVLTPKVKNAAVLRMRPYDKYLQEKFPELNKRDDIFYLGDLAKEIPLFTSIQGYEKTTLGKLWNATNNRKSKFYKQNKEAIEDIFESLTVRVPQDSPSGAQVMKFRGFTGIKNHDVLMHGRAMEAEGGADLDADEAFIYFGGRRPDGSGEGMKKEWKDMFKAQKEEFYTQPERPSIVNKKESELRDYASSLPNTKNVHLVGSTARGAKGRDKDLLIELNDMYLYNKKYLESMINQWGPRDRALEEIFYDAIMDPDSPNAMSFGKLKVEYDLIFKVKNKEDGKTHYFNTKSEQLQIGADSGRMFGYMEPSGKIAQSIEKGAKIDLLDATISNKATNIKDAKEQYRDEIVMTEEQLIEQGLNPTFLNEINNNPYAKYSPAVRVYTGQETAKSRGLMGPIVTMTSNKRQAWSSLRNSREDFDIVQEGTLKIKGTKEEFPVRKIKKALPPSAEQRDYTKALINFTADPANEVGLIPYYEMEASLDKKYFKTEIQVQRNGKWKRLVRLKGNELLNFKPLKHKRYELVRNINSAYFGQNRVENRNWTSYEKNEMIRDINLMDDKAKTTVMFKFANTLKGFNLDISIFDRLDPKALEEIYSKHEKRLSESPLERELYKKILGRTSLAEPRSKEINFVTTEDLHIEANLKYLASRPELTLDKIKSYGIKIKSDKEALENMESYLRRILSDAEDYFPNALHNLTTLEEVIKKYTASKNAGETISDKEMDNIRSKVEDLKELFAINYKKRNEVPKDLNADNIQDVKAQDQLRKLQEKLSKSRPEIGPPITPKSGLETSNRVIDQGNLDATIVKFKEGLSSDYARDMFDILSIGSLRSSKVQRAIDNIIKKPAYKQSQIEKDLLQSLYNEGAHTGTSQMAFDSKSISSRNIINFFKAKNKYFLKSYTPMSEKELDIEVKKIDKEIEKFDNPTDIRQEATIINDINGYEGIVRGKLTPKQEGIANELIGHIKQYRDLDNLDVHKMLAGAYAAIDPHGFPKAFNQMNTNDFKLLNNYFKFLKSGTFHQRMNKAIKDYEKAKLQHRHHLQFPLTVNREMMAHDIKFLPAKGYFRTKAGTIGKFSNILKPTHYGEILQNWIGKMQDEASGQSFGLSKRFREGFKYLSQKGLGKDGDSIWRIAVRNHELEQGYESGEEIYSLNYKESIKKNNWGKIRDKKYIVDLEGVRKEMTGYQLMNMTKNQLDIVMKELYTITRGKKDALDRYITGFYDKDNTQPILDYKSFLMDMEAKYNKGEVFDMDIGIDGMRHMARSMVIDLIPVTEYVGISKGNYGKKINKENFFKLPKYQQKRWRPDKETVAEQFQDYKIQNTGYRKGYFPHLFAETKGLKKARELELEALRKDTSMPKKEKAAKLAQIMFKYKTREGDWDFSDYDMWEGIDKVIFKTALEGVEKGVKKSRDKPNQKTVVSIFGNQNKRVNHQGGWIIDPVSVETYINNMTSTYFRQMSNIMSRMTLNKMENHLKRRWIKGSKKEKKEGAKLVNNWVNFWNMYARDAMGNPVIISKELYNNPDMKIKGNPYSWYADNLIAEKVNSVAEKLGLLKETSKAAKYFENIKDVKGVGPYDMRAWSQVEGKYQLATLMTHPKTVINNVFGGTLHTISSAGFRNLKKARDLKYLESINPNWKTKEDINNFVEELGIQPELLLHEFGLQKEFREGRGKAFAQELSEQVTSMKSIKDIDMTGLAKKYGITNAIMRKAAKFMTIPERELRRDAFMAHYIQAWERLGGAIKDPYHPVLVDIGKKGVKATQFLYSAPFRPGFARSGLGKIMARFQLWSWNAVRFRNDLRNDAKIYGFDKNSEAMNKFKRTMAIDTLIFALSSMFMYSLFEQVLPAPWNWLQDTSDWLFGDEKERDRAFFGTYPRVIAPLQMLTPPIARLPISVIREFADDDYTKLADYYMWTMLPFGRMLRDVAHPEQSIFNNPMRAPEKIFGFPLTGIAREVKKVKESDYRPPTPGFPSLKY